MHVSSCNSKILYQQPLIVSTTIRKGYRVKIRKIMQSLLARRPVITVTWITLSRKSSRYVTDGLHRGSGVNRLNFCHSRKFCASFFPKSSRACIVLARSLSRRLPCELSLTFSFIYILHSSGFKNSFRSEGIQASCQLRLRHSDHHFERKHHHKSARASCLLQET